MYPTHTLFAPQCKPKDGPLEGSLGAGDKVAGRCGAAVADIVSSGRIEAMEPTPEERDDNQFVNLPRIGFEFNRRDHGRLRQLIDVLNSF